jgi:peptidyl-prolyl cis-trans isomerase SurA
MKRNAVLMIGLGMWRALALMAGLTAMLSGGAAIAQSDQFAAAITVNGTVITRYELNQRRAFLEALHQPGDLEGAAVEGLINDRLQMDAAKTLGVTASDADITAGMAEFAARGNLSSADFLKALAGSAVEPETFRDFVKAGVLWRAVLREKFSGKVRVTDAEVDRAIAQGAASGGPRRVLLAEIVLPEDGKSNVGALARRIRDGLKSAADFAQAARMFSKVDTAASGGVLGWMDVTALPPAVASVVAKMKPGEISAPVSQQGAVAIYMLRDESEAKGDARRAPQVDYAVFQPAPGQDLTRLQAASTGCDALDVAARGRPAAALQRQTQAESAVPPALRGALAGLDAGESVILTGPSGTAELVMLCERRPQSAVAPSKDDVKTMLINRKLGLLAAAYLEELRSDAIILRP